MRWLLALLCLTFTAFSHANATPSLGGSPIDKVLVIKSERKLHLVSAGQTLKSYRISLGNSRTVPSSEGDMRTPEGLYWIDWRKTSDKYNLSMHISYPNARDLAARNRKVCPGKHDHAARHASGRRVSRMVLPHPSTGRRAASRSPTATCGKSGDW